MEANKYLICLSVAEEGNITKAAEKLGYTQSGVSHTIKRFEDELGITLFVRKKSGVQLTMEGEQILQILRDMSNCYEKFEEVIGSMHNIYCGTLKIATFASISINWLPPILRRFKKDYPGIDIEIYEGGSQDIAERINNHSVNFGLLSKQSKDSFEWITLGKDPLYAVLPNDEAYQGLKTFPIQSFQDNPFIMSALGTDYDIHQVLKQGQVVPNVRFSSKDDYAIAAMVAGGLGLSILPKLILDGVNQDVITVPLEPYAERTLGIGYLSKQTLSPAAKKFMEYIRIHLEKTKQ